MELQIGDRLTDETGEGEVIGQPDVTDLRTWGAHERVSVERR
jgi:hypothetical protein